jgi:hypothetical protein
VYASFGGQLRYRAEGVRAFMLGGPGDRDDAFGLTRALVHADVHAGPYLRAFVEGKHAVATGRALPGERRAIDHDEMAVQNAFVDVACCRAGGLAGATLRVGRQELQLGRERLVSPLDWVNTRRTFDGARLQGRRGAVSLDAFWTRPVTVRQTAPNAADSTTRFWGVTLLRRGGPSSGTLEGYVLGLEQDASASFAGLRGAHRRVTTGGRVARPLFDARTTVDVEGAWQSGRLAGERVGAWFVASELARAFPAAPLKPVLAVGADYASGDARPGDGRAGTFHQLFPLAHAYAGFMDVLGRQNLGELRAVASGTLPHRVAVRVAGHHFARAERADALYGAAGAALRPAASSGGRSIGDEVDVTAGRRFGRHLKLDAGYGHFIPAAGLRRSSAGATPSDWGFLGATLTY